MNAPASSKTKAMFDNDHYLGRVVCLQDCGPNDRLVDRVLRFTDSTGQPCCWGLHCGVPQQEVLERLEQEGIADARVESLAQVKP